MPSSDRPRPHERASHGKETLDAPADSAPAAVAAEPPRYVPEQVIGAKYRLTRVLGEGGMGSVWLAKNLTLDIDVAVKLIRREVAIPEAAERLLTEARAAARISHPAIVRVFDFGVTEQDDPFIVMELLNGESLATVLARKGKLPAANAVLMLLPVASALVEAHGKGIVHRDLKPDNIVLLTDEPGVVCAKLVDFGIAKLRRDDLDRQLTNVGAVLGSPDYMSPEQARGRGSVDERTDVWAFSVVLYEVLTGQLPFAGASYNELLTSILEDAPRPLTELGVPEPELWKIVEKGLAKRAGDRWPSMRALGTALAEWAHERGHETDLTGGSIAIAWLGQSSKRPLSIAPAPALAERGSPPAVPEEKATVAEKPRPATEMSSVRPAAEPAKVRPPASSKRAIVLAAVLAVGAAGLFVGRKALTGAPPAVPAASVAVAAPAPRPSQPPAPEAVAPAVVAAPAAPVASLPVALAVAAPPRDVNACAARSYADATFEPGKGADFAFLCTETDPRKGARAMKSVAVIASGKRTTEAMKEWALLGWYEMAAFAAVRAACCEAPPAMVLPPPVGKCAPIDAALDAFGAAVAKGEDADEPMKRYATATACLLNSHTANSYSYTAKLKGGEDVALKKTLARLAKK